MSKWPNLTAHQKHFFLAQTARNARVFAEDNGLPKIGAAFAEIEAFINETRPRGTPLLTPPGRRAA